MSFHKAATVLMSLLLATTAHADDEFGPIDFCRDISLIANQVMTARQQNRPMSETIPKATNRIKDWSDKYGFDMDMHENEEAAADMVMAAYRKMISPVEDYKRLNITDFENVVFQECYEAAASDNVLPELPVSSPSGMWAVQLGSFSGKENAEALAADLRRQGYAAFLSELKLDAGSLYRVRIGPQKDMASAESMAARLLGAGYKGEIVPHP